MFRAILCALLASTAAVSVASADTVRGPYVGFDVGAALPGGVPFPGKGNGAGPAIAGSLGYGLGNGMRVELQGDGLAWGSKRQFGFYGNALYDFNVGDWAHGVTPYAGVGIGYQRARIGGNYDGDGSFAAQGILGASYDIKAVPGLSAAATYRLIGITHPMVFRGGPVTVHTNAGVEQALMLGVRYSFGGPSAPVPPVAPVHEIREAAPAHAASYVVFFDTGSAVLGRNARQIVANAAAAAKAGPHVAVEVRGYADATGTAAFNQTLSRKRAAAVAAELARNGVPSGEISVHGYGAVSDPLPAVPGVAHPTNRRVEVVVN